VVILELRFSSTSASSVQAELYMIYQAPPWYVYLLLCDNQFYYVGITTRVKERIQAHNDKKSFYTKQYSKIELVYCEKYTNKHEAARREKQLKGWSQTKKQMLIDGKLGYNICTEIIEELSQLANNNNLS